MALITKNFRLNALANQYATALYNHISTISGDHFMINANGQPIQVNIIGGVQGVRDLINGYALEALRDSYPQQWEAIGIQLLSKCVHGDELTTSGREIWQSMVNDMSDTVAGNM
ncbi:hypothetical protein I5373_02920 [Citrobacter koseri]|uniref:hypothetical protein n=1 Tax=Citrobacter TaxID=544 RepID=UPI0019060051|nr:MULTISPECIES: hypothetical protein [Citrobacter]EMD6814794.1 hypothetical protein [Citrobacter koseri]MBJ8670286.1 hypothetical protein [Citrobacter koseri]MDM2994013.1 hypothetical protein [Citrobacter sp. CK195]MDM2994776.1 hypothetical protein [Citrobacter sp. CK195]MDQ2325037.1 hypothetical protein [Citrobacter koseri]